MVSYHFSHRGRHGDGSADAHYRCWTGTNSASWSCTYTSYKTETIVRAEYERNMAYMSVLSRELPDIEVIGFNFCMYI